MELTTTEAAEILGLSARRVHALIANGQLDARKVGPDRRGIWLINRLSVDRRLLVQEAQRAWASLGIPPRLWGAWWLADPDEIDAFTCPACGQVAYSPAGDTKYSGLAACPACGWVER